jgi:glycosyltransferase involved in cell wall biosynthesis
MKIETYILAHQEEKMIAYTMRHYTQFSDVILMEGHSTDRTVEIAESFGARIMKVDTHNEVNDAIYLEIKNNCWKGSKADWVIIVDTDEFVFHPNLIEYLKSTDSTIFRPRLFNMYSEEFPTTEGQIYDEVKYGVDGGGKTNLFRPDQITEINYLPGCHNARPEGNVILNIHSDIYTLHFKNLSRQYVIERNAYLFNRLSEVNKHYKWGCHVGKGAEAVNKDFDDVQEQLIKVI